MTPPRLTPEARGLARRHRERRDPAGLPPRRRVPHAPPGAVHRRGARRAGGGPTPSATATSCSGSSTRAKPRSAWPRRRMAAALSLYDHLQRRYLVPHNPFAKLRRPQAGGTDAAAGESGMPVIRRGCRRDGCPLATAAAGGAAGALVPLSPPRRRRAVASGRSAPAPAVVTRRRRPPRPAPVRTGRSRRTGRVAPAALPMPPDRRRERHNRHRVPPARPAGRRPFRAAGPTPSPAPHVAARCGATARGRRSPGTWSGGGKPRSAGLGCGPAAAGEGIGTRRLQSRPAATAWGNVDRVAGRSAPRVGRGGFASPPAVAGGNSPRHARKIRRPHPLRCAAGLRGRILAARGTAPRGAGSRPTAALRSAARNAARRCRPRCAP